MQNPFDEYAVGYELKRLFIVTEFLNEKKIWYEKFLIIWKRNGNKWVRRRCLIVSTWNDREICEEEMTIEGIRKWTRGATNCTYFG